MKFLGKMCFKLILNVTKNEGLTLSLEDTFFEKSQWGSNWRIIIDKILNIFNVNRDSLQLRFLKNIWVVLCLTFCNLGVSTFPINSFSITFISLSPWNSAKHFTASRLSRVSYAVTFLTFCLSSAISSSSHWLKGLCNASFSAF